MAGQRKARGSRQRGFSLLEMLIVLVVFLIVSGAVFELLNVAQLRYRAEQEFLESFQGARLGMDLMVRDIHNAGYPPPWTFAGNFGQPPTPASYPAGIWENPLDAPADVQRRFAIGVLGIDAAGNMSTTCTVNGGATPCSFPSPWEIILEVDLDPENPDPITGTGPRVEWVRYDLRRPGNTATLFRTVTPKIPGGNPRNPNVQSNVPFIEEIVQNPATGVTAANPAVFTYECAPNMVVVGATNVCRAEHVQNVYITLTVQSTRPDLQTGQLRQITLRGMASRYYPNRQE